MSDQTKPKPAPEEKPQIHPGPIKEILERLGELEANIETLEVHLKTSVDQTEMILRNFNEIFVRLDVVERKTFSLADRPGQMNCPECGRKVANPQLGRCGMCGYVFPQ